MAPPVTLTLGHSPDPDDAFMWWPLFEGLVVLDGFTFVQVAEDIESLNRRAAGDASALLDITAMSCANAPLVRDRYLVTACGASVGEGYGPRLVAARSITVDALRDRGATVAVPGLRTTAFLAASLLLGRGRFRPVEVPFDRIEDSVRAGEVAAGVVIHEGQLLFESRGLTLVEDLGRWWGERTGLVLPLGVNAVRSDLDERFGPGTIARICGVLARSVQYALSHRAEGVRRALRFARGIEPATADRFVGLYVNRWTLELGSEGRRAVERLVLEAAKAGVLPPDAAVAFAPPLRDDTLRPLQ